MFRDHVFADRSLLRHIARFLRPQHDRWLCEFCAVHAPTYYTHRGYNHMTRMCYLAFVQLRREHEQFQASPEYQEAFRAWLAQRSDRP